jgi:hypothetical protein
LNPSRASTKARWMCIHSRAGEPPSAASRGSSQTRPTEIRPQHRTLSRRSSLPCSTLPSPAVTTDELLLRVNTADDWRQRGTQGAAPVVLVTVVLGLVAGGIAGVLFVTAQLTAKSEPGHRFSACVVCTTLDSLRGCYWFRCRPHIGCSVRQTDRP